MKKKARVILNALGSRDQDELSLTFVDDPDIAVLNRDYLHREGPTNVISFPMEETCFCDPFLPRLLGDVVISVETAEREAALAGITVEERLSQLLIHGILHLFDYDHERSPGDEIKMSSKSLELLRLIEINTELDYF
jgi:probable rRNA maturation factor